MWHSAVQEKEKTRPGRFSAPGVSVTLYYPLWPGNRWQYLSTNKLTVETGCDVTQSLEDEEILDVYPFDNGGVGVVVRHRLQIEGQQQLFQTRLQQDTRVTTDLETRAVYLRAPLQAGASWSWLDDNENMHVSEICSPESVAVPAGHFPECLRVRESFRTRLGKEVGTRSDWYAPQVGRVKSILRHESDGHGCYEETRELKSFELK